MQRSNQVAICNFRLRSQFCINLDQNKDCAFLATSFELFAGNPSYSGSGKRKGFWPELGDPPMLCLKKPKSCGREILS